MILEVLTCTGRMDPIMSEVFTVLGCGGSGGGGGGGIAIASMSCDVERSSPKPIHVFLRVRKDLRKRYNWSTKC